MRRSLKGKAAASKKQSGNSSATPTPTEDEQERSIWKLPWGNARNIFGPTPGRSTPSPSLTQNDSTTSIYTTNTPPVTTPVHKSHKERDAEGNSTTATPPNNPSSGPLKLGELLLQEASDLWTKAYNDLPSECKQDLEDLGNTDSGKPEILETLLELAMEAKRKNIASQWTFKWGDKNINVREKAEKLVGWIEKFKEVVNIAVQYDPVHAALPWAGVRFILTACPLFQNPLRPSFQLLI